MDYRVQGRDIIVHEPDLDLDETLDCGQAFRRDGSRSPDCRFSFRYPAENYVQVWI